MWAVHSHRLEPLQPLSAQWHCFSLECGWQIVFTHNEYISSKVFVSSLRSVGGVFEKRAGMLFPTKLCFVRDVHRRDGVYSLALLVHETASLSSKIVTKNIRVDFFFKTPKPKERPKEAPFRGKNIPTETVERSFSSLNLKEISGILSVFFPGFTSLILKQAFRTARMKKISGLQPDDLKNHSFRPKYQPSCSEGKPERLEEMPFLIADVAPLTLQNADAFNELTTLPIGLTPPSIPTPDEGVLTPSDADVRTTCFDALLLAVPGLTLDASVRALATKGRHVDADDGLMKKTFKQLITNEYC